MRSLTKKELKAAERFRKMFGEYLNPCNTTNGVILLMIRYSKTLLRRKKTM